MNLGHLRDRHRARTHRASLSLSALSGHGHGDAARRFAPLRADDAELRECGRSRSNARVVCVCVACSAIAIASCAILGGPIEYAWQVTMSHANLPRGHQRLATSSSTPPVVFINTESHAGQRTNQHISHLFLSHHESERSRATRERVLAASATAARGTATSEATFGATCRLFV